MIQSRKTIDGIGLAGQRTRNVSVMVSDDVSYPVAVQVSRIFHCKRMRIGRVFRSFTAAFLSLGVMLWRVVVPISAFEAHVINVTAVIEDRTCTVVDFDRDSNGASIQAGQVIDAEYTPWGLTILADNHVTTHPDLAIAFNSDAPTSGDEDLGTPHEDFGGPGVGAGGKSGTPGENARPQHNVLIIAENDRDVEGNGILDLPDDEAFGGVLIFSFAEETWMESLRILDIEEQGGEIRLFNDALEEFQTFPIPVYGDNSTQLFPIHSAGVKEMHIALVGSGAVDDVCIEQIEQSIPELSAPVLDVPEEPELPPIVLNEFLPNPSGVAYGFDFGADSSDKPQGEWVELYNNGTEAYDLSGWYVWDASGSDTNKIEITSSNTGTATTTIEAGAWLVVYMNKAVLNNSGDTVTLYTAEDIVIDEHAYTTSENACALEPTAGEENATSTSTGVCSGVPANKSFARIPDGIGAWVDPVPTPGKQNKVEEVEVETEEPVTESTSTDASNENNDIVEDIEEVEAIVPEEQPSVIEDNDLQIESGDTLPEIFVEVVATSTATTTDSTESTDTDPVISIDDAIAGDEEEEPDVTEEDTLPVFKETDTILKQDEGVSDEEDADATNIDENTSDAIIQAVSEVEDDTAIIEIVVLP